MPASRLAPTRSPRWLSGSVLLAGLLMTAAASYYYSEALQREARIALERAADRFDLIIESRLDACGTLVRAIQLLLSSDPAMDAEEFGLRIAALRVERSFPSLQAAAYAERTLDADGHERYRTTLIAPERGNEALWGLDVTRQPENLRVLKQALALDEARISAPFELIQYAGQGQLPDGVVIRLPVIEPGVPATDSAQRIARERGSIAVSFRLSTLIDDAIRSLDHPIDYELRLHAAPQDGGHLVYSSASSGLSAAGEAGLPAASAQVDYGGRSLRLSLLPGSSWFAQARREAWILALSGGLASLLLAAWVGALVRVRQRAERLAERLAVRAQQSEARFRRLSDLLPVATVLAESDSGRIDYINAAGSRLLAVSDQAPGRLQDFGIAAAANGSEDSEAATLRTAEGRSFQAELSEATVEVDGRSHRLVVIDDVTERLQLTAQLRHQASHDALTGLHNRREFDRRLQRAVDGREPALATGALLYIDLDQFKLINDTCGHVAGDQLLARVAAVLQSALAEPSATVARLGGDEFGVLVAADSAAVIRSIAERLRNAVEALRFVWEGRSFSLTASIGAVALGGSAGRPAGELLSIADTACYLAKEAGRNRVMVHDEDESASLQRRSEMDWVQRIRDALAENRFCLCYQELQSLRAGDQSSDVHFELLVRMRDERGQMVPPGAFIPAAERYGVMPAVDRWVVETALRHFERLHPAGEAIGLCAINLSGPTMGDDTFPEFLLEQLRRSSVPAERLCFEITETAAVANFAQAVALINELRSLGCKVALDDFGAGMSSFGYLKQLPVDYIKIDGVFIREFETDAMSQSIVRAVTEIGHQFKTRVVAEFVGSASTRDLLARIGVDYAQGFGIHVPALSPLYAADAVIG